MSGANLTYAEIEHKNRKQKATPRDKNSVLYSEIKVEEVGLCNVVTNVVCSYK